MPKNEFKVWHICQCGKSAIALSQYATSAGNCLWCLKPLQPVPSEILKRHSSSHTYRDNLRQYAQSLAEQWEQAA